MTPNAREDYKSLESLSWKPTELQSGKTIKINTFPKFKKVKLFRRVIASSNNPEYVASNDLNQSTTSDVQKVCAIRGKVEKFHRELKQLTGIESSRVP
ncbi:MULTISPECIES: hypothetical protein [unclassified Microcoleus]|uniref:hypothetical protein n=1 Tax=unclassified Microcoleus TaxID=2642155 RepID=UPI004040BE38